MNIDQTINESFAPISAKAFDIILYSVPIAGQDVKLLLVWLAAVALGFTLYFGFINVRLFGHAIDIVRGKFDKKDEEGHINSFQALMASMSGTVGLGNIAGVAVAVSLGGPGAVLWMIILGFFSMSTKFVEVALGVKYRKRYDFGEGRYRVAGGPMYYLKSAFDHYNIPYLGRGMAIVFALCCIIGAIGGGMMFQSNQAFQQIYNVTGGADGFLEGRAWMFGCALAIMVGVVVVGGIKSIASVASRLVPLMAGLYFVAALYVIVTHVDNVPAALGSIWDGAFNMQAGIGGLLGTILVGFQRAAFSNESGLGTAAIVYSATRGHDHIRQGIASMLGPFIDTICVCTLTALMILISGAYDPSAQMEGVELTSRALAQGASWLPTFLAVIIFLFAYSTMITFAYVSGKALAFVFGQSLFVDKAYKLIYCLFAIIGCSANLNHLIDFTDAAFLSMAIPNLIGLMLLAPVVKGDLKAYLADMKSQKSE
ncbi:MAG: alanine glycine permease [Alphaproteobacteria bacterium]|nr:alanine glycine permease [Alphaproteobacteria bacterium]HCQ71232.1 alanine glycine permease [Rhodospirillaceae bacterium]